MSILLVYLTSDWGEDLRNWILVEHRHGLWTSEQHLKDGLDCIAGPSTNFNPLGWLDFEEHLRTLLMERWIHTCIARISFGNMTMTLSWHPTFIRGRHKPVFLLLRLSQWEPSLIAPGDHCNSGFLYRWNLQWCKITCLMRWLEVWGCNSGEMPWRELMMCVYEDLWVLSW